MTYAEGELMLSRDRKVSPRGTLRSKPRPMWVPAVRNSFGLPSGSSCPGKTPFCKSCYAVGSEQSAGVRAGVQRNFDLLLEAGSLEGMARLLSSMLDRAWRQLERLPAEQRLFRIHWDGDFFSLDYAGAWALAMGEHPGIQFWAYTRSFVEPVDVVPVLAGVPNLALYLSTDRWNAEAAAPILAAHPSVLAALCEEDYRSGRALVPGRSPIICPENAGRMQLMENGVGACVTCGVCTVGRRDVLFSTSHREDASIPVAIRRRVPGMQPPAAYVRCKRPGCDGMWLPAVGRGRPREYCNRSCQLRARTLRAKSA